MLPCQTPKLRFEPIQDYTIQPHHGISEVYRIWDLAWVMASCIGGTKYDVSDSAEKDDKLSSDASASANKRDGSGGMDIDRDTSAEKYDSGGFSEYVRTWNAYNSLITTTGTKTNAAVFPPSIRHSPTSWPGLYTASTQH